MNDEYNMLFDKKENELDQILSIFDNFINLFKFRSRVPKIYTKNLILDFDVNSYIGYEKYKEFYYDKIVNTSSMKLMNYDGVKSIKEAIPELDINFVNIKMEYSISYNNIINLLYYIENLNHNCERYNIKYNIIDSPKNSFNFNLNLNKKIKFNRNVHNKIIDYCNDYYIKQIVNFKLKFDTPIDYMNFNFFKKEFKNMDNLVPRLYKEYGLEANERMLPYIIDDFIIKV